jgi:DNA topoisomerase-1
MRVSGNKLVIVESPAKAKTINKYLGDDYTVIASYGHIRDLVQKDGSVLPEEDFAMRWELGERSDKAVREITNAAKQASSIYLASDPDREGEAIAWHVREVLREKNVIKTTPVHRVTFHEITKSAVQDALAHPRELDQELIDAYMARRALDYLVGFSLSPVLWRKLPGAKSAGRVQSVALRLICERESEIEKFIAQEYWTIAGTFKTAQHLSFSAHLTQLNGKKLDKFALKSEPEAVAATAFLNQLTYQVGSVEKKQLRRNPYAPFTTSTLQQEASRKLGFGASRTMRMAQQLYEGIELGGETVGLITYMRTDGVTLSQEAIQSARTLITKEWGDQYLPDTPRIYKAAAKNAQEAHEAIRPTDLTRRPEHVAKYLEGDMLKLYTLIWQRTLASQMASAVLDQVSADIVGGNQQAVFRAVGTTMVFDGFQRVYQESEDDEPATKGEGDEQRGTRLPPLKAQEVVSKTEVKPEQHFTQPPPRYSEASLVKRLEELGIGRPSTYASIMQVLQDRDYVILDKKRFVPEDRGRIVTAFLENFFGTYVQYDFTASLENKLDDISGGRIAWKNVLREFWQNFSGAIANTKDLKITDVINALDEALGPHFFPPQPDGTDPRQCQVCQNGRMGLKLGKFGAFIGCSNYPECRNTRPLAVTEGGADAPRHEGPREIGIDPTTSMPISVRVGPYGAYVQLGPLPTPPLPVSAPEEPKPKKKRGEKVEKAAPPKRVSLLKNMDPNQIDLDTALRLLALPRDIGGHPETGEMIQAGTGRFGPFLKCGSKYKSLAPEDDLLTIGLNRAVVLLAEPSKGRFGGAATATTPTKQLGDHPAAGGKITQHSGRFGPYVKHGKLMATITKGYDADTLTLEQAVEILTAKAAKGGKAPAAKATKATKPKAEAKAKPAAKPKTVAKKTTTTKAKTATKPKAAAKPKKAKAE